MQKLEIDKKIEKPSDRKKYTEPQLQVMGKMSRMTKGVKGGSQLDTDGQTPDYQY